MRTRPAGAHRLPPTLLLALLLLLLAPLAGGPGVAAVGPSAAPVGAPQVGGALSAWGEDDYGQLGDGGANANQSSPVSVDLPANVVAVAAGFRHSLAVTAEGRVYAWGYDYFGQLGDGPDESNTHPTPVLLDLPANVVAVAAGSGHSLALTADGRVYAWGYDIAGQLGDGPDESNTHPTPVLLDLPANVVAVAAGSGHSLALTADGRVYAWGDDSDGQLGNGPNVTAAQPTPVPVALPANVVAIAAGMWHSLAVTSEGDVYAWGHDESGQVGDGGEDADQGSPVLLPVPTNVVAVAAGTEYSLAVTAEGRVYAWGSDVYGQLGDGGTNANQATPVLVPTLTNVVAIAAGYAHSLALTAEGRVYAWGSDEGGQLGDGGENADQATPVLLPTPTNVVAVAAGIYYSLVIGQVSSAFAWGNDGTGQLGNGTGVTGEQSVPVPVTLPTNVVAVAAGYAHSLAATAEGRVYAWGSDDGGQLGDGGGNTYQATPVPVPMLTNVVAVAAGYAHSLALTAAGRVYAWGSDEGGQLGDGPDESDTHPTPVLLDLPTNVVAVAAGTSHSLAVTAEGRVYAWGSDGSGQVGDGPDESDTHPTPVLLDLPANVVAVAAGSSHSLALTAAGRVYAWGSDGSGQVGDGPDESDTHPTPVLLDLPANVVAVAAGSSHSLALTAAGRVYAWGLDDTGQLGDGGANANQGSPVLLDLPANVVAVAAGTDHSLAVTAAGRVYAWGSDGSGQVGDGGASAIHASPVLVPTLTNVVAVAAGATHSLALGRAIERQAVPTSVVAADAAAGVGAAGVTLSATVTDNEGPVAEGSVTFTVTGPAPATTVVGSPVAGAVSGGTASVTYPLPPGTASGSYTIAAAYGGSAAFAPADDTATLTLAQATSALTAVRGTATYGEANGAVTATLTGADNAPLVGATVRFTVQGSAVCGGSGRPACPKTNGAGVATLGGVAFGALNAGNYANRVCASFAGNATYAGTGPVCGSLQVQRRILWLKPQDRTVGLRQPNPATTPPANCAVGATGPTACWLELTNGSSFASGESWASLNLANVRFAYNRSGNGPATEKVGAQYRITVAGALNQNYDIRYQTGILRVVAP